MAQRGARVPEPAVALVGGEVRLDDDAVDTEGQRGAQRGDFLDPRLGVLGGGDGARRHRRVRCGVDSESGRTAEGLAVGQLGQCGGELPDSGSATTPYAKNVISTV